LNTITNKPTSTLQWLNTYSDSYKGAGVLVLKGKSKNVLLGYQNLIISSSSLQNFLNFLVQPFSTFFAVYEYCILSHFNSYPAIVYEKLSFMKD